MTEAWRGNHPWAFEHTPEAVRGCDRQSSIRRRYQQHRELVLRGSLTACVAGAALWAQQQPVSAPWLRYTLSQTALMAAASLAATVRRPPAGSLEVCCAANDDEAASAHLQVCRLSVCK